MPLYEYGCKQCGARFEVLVRTDGDHPKECPKCGAKKIEKQFSAFSASVQDGRSGGASCNTGSCPTGTCPFA